MTYEQYMSTEFDTKFCEAEDLTWYPWVGKNYHKTGILILGVSTHKDENGDDWTRDLGHVASRTFFDFGEYPTEHKPFRTISEMFLDGAGIDYKKRTCEKFWSSVAFNNYYQVAVEESGAKPENEADIESAKRAFYQTVAIIKPKLCIAWSTSIDQFGVEEERKHYEKIRGAYPRFSKNPCLIVGVKHPSWWSLPNAGEEARKRNHAEWFDFLSADQETKQPITNLINHLQMDTL